MNIRYHSQACLALLLSVSSCHIAPRSASKTQSEGRRVGDYKGFREISEAIRRHVRSAADSGANDLGSYIGAWSSSSYSPSLSGLLSLLGGYVGTGADNAVEGGEPNAMTMMLWDTMLSGLADDIGALCEPGSSSFENGVDPAYQKTVLSLCAWPAPQAMTSAHLLALWSATLGDEVSEEEQAQWVQGVLAPDSGFASLNGAAAVRALTRSLLLNPHFLLEE